MPRRNSPAIFCEHARGITRRTERTARPAVPSLVAVQSEAHDMHPAPYTPFFFLSCILASGRPKRSIEGHSHRVIYSNVR